MMPIRIIPRYRLLLQYDVHAEMFDQYYRYVTTDFVPSLERMQVYLIGVWHTAYGQGPARQVEFVTDQLGTIRQALQSQRWQMLEEQLLVYTFNYQRRVIRYREGFQF